MSDRSKKLIKRISICIQASKQFFQEINLEIIRENAIVTWSTCGIRPIQRKKYICQDVQGFEEKPEDLYLPWD